MSPPLLLRRVGITLVGTALVLLGLALLALPGPGMLVIAAGVVLLSWEYPVLKRWSHPLRERAVRAARESVRHPLRFAALLALGAGMVGCGVAWGAVRSLPYSSPWSGAGLVVAGLALLATILWAWWTRPRP